MAAVDALMSMSAGLLPSTRLVPVVDALAMAAGVAVGATVATGVAEGGTVGEATGEGAGVALGAAVTTGVADGRGVADAAAEAEVVGTGDALGVAVIDGTAAGEDDGVAPLMGATGNELLPLQAGKTAAEAQIRNAATPRRGKNEYIENRSQERSKRMCRDRFDTSRKSRCERSYG